MNIKKIVFFISLLFFMLMANAGAFALTFFENIQNIEEIELTILISNPKSVLLKIAPTTIFEVIKEITKIDTLKTHISAIQNFLTEFDNTSINDIKLRIAIDIKTMQVKDFEIWLFSENKFNISDKIQTKLAEFMPFLSKLGDIKLKKLPYEKKTTIFELDFKPDNPTINLMELFDENGKRRVQPVPYILVVNEQAKRMGIMRKDSRATLLSKQKKSLLENGFEVNIKLKGIESLPPFEANFFVAVNENDITFNGETNIDDRGEVSGDYQEKAVDVKIIGFSEPFIVLTLKIDTLGDFLKEEVNNLFKKFLNITSKNTFGLYFDSIGFISGKDVSINNKTVPLGTYITMKGKQKTVETFIKNMDKTSNFEVIEVDDWDKYYKIFILNNIPFSIAIKDDSVIIGIFDEKTLTYNTTNFLGRRNFAWGEFIFHKLWYSLKESLENGIFYGELKTKLSDLLKESLPLHDSYLWIESDFHNFGGTLSFNNGTNSKNFWIKFFEFIDIFHFF